MVLFRVALALVSIAVVAATASAATVSPMGGDVRISIGHGFHRIDVPTELAAGGQIMVSPDGSASITYSDNCVVPASPATITVIQSQPVCGSFPKPSYFGFAQSDEVGLSVEQDAFGFTPKVGTPRTTTSSSPTTGGGEKKEEPAAAPVPLPAPPAHEEGHDGSSNHTVLIIGGVVVAGGVLAAVLASQGDDGPASP